MHASGSRRLRLITLILSSLLLAGGALIMTLALTLGLENAGGYFSQPYPTLLLISLVVAVLFAFALIPLDFHYEETETAEPIPLRVGALIATLGSAVFAILLFTTLPKGGSILQIATAICALATTLYFLLIAAGETPPSAARGIVGMGYLTLHVLYVMVLYFQNSTAANAPIKTALLVAWLVSLLFSLVDVRLSLGRKPHPLSHALSRLAAILCGGVGLGGVLAAILGVALPYGVIPHIFLLVYTLYIIIRMLFIPKIVVEAPIAEEITDTPEAPLAEETSYLPPEEKPLPQEEIEATTQSSTFYQGPRIEMGTTDEVVNLTDPAPKKPKGDDLL